MRRAFSLQDQILLLIFLFLSKTYPYVKVEAIQGPSVPNWCSERHCQDCAKSAFLLCLNDALNISCGDLCGCCQSCVQLRDLGESCGSQLAVRSSAEENFGDPKSRVTILATSSCRRGLICTDFVCRRRNEEARLPTISIPELNKNQVSSNWDSETKTFQESSANFNVLFGPSRNVLNLIIADREFQLIYGHDALVDLRILLESVDKSQSNSILDESEAATIYERFKNLLDYINNKNDVPVVKKEIKKFDNNLRVKHKTSHSPKAQETVTPEEQISRTKNEFLVYWKFALPKNSILAPTTNTNIPRLPLGQFRPKRHTDAYETKKNVGPKFELEEKQNDQETSIPKSHNDGASKFLIYWKFPLRQDFQLAPKQNPRVLLEQCRRKRHAEATEKSNAEQQIINVDQNDPEKLNPSAQVNKATDFRIYGFSDRPRTMQDVDRHWLVAGATPEDKSPARRMEASDAEPAINIHIAGAPATTVENLSFEVSREASLDSVEEDYDDYDEDAEVFVTGVAAEESVDSSNFGKVDEPSERRKNVRSDEVDESTETGWKAAENSAHNSEFPEKNRANDFSRELSVRVDETTSEFRDRLTRIETWVATIATSMLRIFSTLRHDEEKSAFVDEAVDATTENASPSSARSRNANAPGRRREAMNIQSRGTPGALEANQFIGRSATTPRNKIVRSPGGNSTRRHRHPPRWRTLAGSNEAEGNFSGGRGRPDGATAGDAVDRETRLDFRGKKLTPNPAGDFGKRRVEPDSRGARQIPDDEMTEFPRRKATPGFLAETDYGKLPKLSSETFSQRNNVPGLFADGRWNFEADSAGPFLGRSSASKWRTVWPLSPAWNTATLNLDLERSKRTSTSETPVLREAVFPETQIPKSIRTGQLKGFGRLREKSWGIGSAVPMSMAASMTQSRGGEFSEKFVEDTGSWNWDNSPSFNLFVVENWNSDFGLESSAEENESLGQQIESRLPTGRRDRGRDDSWDQIYPEYLDYSDRNRKLEEENVNPEVTTETPLRREKRSVKKNLQDVWRNLEKFHDFRINSEGNEGRLDPNNETMKKDGEKPSITSTNLEDTSENSSGSVSSENSSGSVSSENSSGSVSSENSSASVSSENSSGSVSSSNSSGRRTRRNVQMVDWLRAAREYHDRLRQVRNAALKTWLASRAELDDTNLTNVKLFTREIPAYLGKYQPSYLADDESRRAIEDSGIFGTTVGNEDPESTDEFVGKIVSGLSSHLEDIAKAKRSPDQGREISSSTMPRKFTIIATGNSTIRIEQMPERVEDSEASSSFDDQSGEASTSGDLQASRRADFESSETEDFDHMYESFDAEDEDFDYDDQSFAISRFLDGIDVIDDSNAEATSDDDGSFEDYDEDDEDDLDDEIADVFGRSKREAPVFLFKVKRRPSQEVVVWPSNWKDLVSRHAQLNRSRTSAAQSRRSSGRSYARISKIGRHARSRETSGESFQAGSDKSAGSFAGDEGIPRHSEETDTGGPPQHVVDIRGRGGRAASWKR